MAELQPDYRPTYSSLQLDQYFSHIGFTKPRISGQDARSSAGLSYLTSLQKHHMAAVPFENLSLHYSPYHVIQIDPQSLFHKIVDKGHGGYCMENNCFFYTVMISLGFDVYTAGARVNRMGTGGSEDVYLGWYVCQRTAQQLPHQVANASMP